MLGNLEEQMGGEEGSRFVEDEGCACYRVEAGSVTDALNASTETTLDDVHEVSESRSNV